MKTFCKTLLTCFIILILTGCTKNEFKIEFQFPSDFFGNYLVAYYAHDSRGGWWVEQTASIQDGIATVNGATRLPTVVYISDASIDSRSIAIYVERGEEIKIVGENSDMSSWSVTGDKVSERWSAWRNKTNASPGDWKALEKSIREYVGNNPSDKLSALLLLTEWNRREDPQGFLNLWNSIDKKVRSTELIEMCGASDILGVNFTTKADGNLALAKEPNLKKVVFRSLHNGVDTLRFNKAKASFLYFYSENNSARKMAADTIRALSKAYADSTNRIISDISVDTDSMTWISSMRRDSITGVIRAWQPKGIAEEDMVKLGVRQLPWIIIKDKDGKETYSGDDLKKATAAFRKEMKKTPASKPNQTSKI